jgi:hypothetical protein
MLVRWKMKGGDIGKRMKKEWPSSHHSQSLVVVACVGVRTPLVVPEEQ